MRNKRTMSWPRISYMDGEIVRIVVPTEDDQECHVEFRRNWQRLTWEFEVSDELIRQSPEGVHAILGLALMELKKVTPDGRSL